MFHAARLTLLDIGVICLYCVGLIIAGWLEKRRTQKARDYFLAGQSAAWPRVGFALYASTISATALVGLTGSAYAHGISAFNYEWSACVVLTIFCAFVLPTYLRSQVFTVPEFLELRYGRFVRTYVSGLSIVLGIFLDASGALFAGALLFQVVFPAWPLWQVCGLLAVLAGGFLVAGGLRAVLAIEQIQGLIMVMACATLAVFTFKVAGGWEVSLARLEPSHLSLIRPANDPTMPWTGLATGVPLIGFYFWCTNQTMVQRVLAARSLDHGRWGSLLGGSLKLSNLFLVILPGAIAVQLFPHLDQPDEVFSHIVFEVLPHGLIGLILAACLVSILSNLSGIYNATATLFTMDFIRRAKPDLSEAHLVRIGQVVTLVIMALSIVWAPQILHFKDTLWQYLQGILCYFVPPIAAVFICGLFVKRASATGAALGLILGTLASIGLFIGVEILRTIPIHFLVCAAIIFGISLAGLLIGSLFGPTPDPGVVRPLMFSKAIWDAETRHLQGSPWYKNYRVLSVALLVLTATVVLAFA